MRESQQMDMKSVVAFFISMGRTPSYTKLS